MQAAWLAEKRLAPSAVALLIALCCGAFVLRLFSIDALFPYVDYVDEGHVVGRVAAIIESQRFELRWYAWPHSLVWLHALFGKAYALLAGVDPGMQSCSSAMGDYGDLARQWTYYSVICPPELLLVSRSLTALFGAATLVPLFWLTRALWGVRAGLCAAALLMVMPGHVEYSRYPSGDVPMSFFLLWAVYFSLRLYRSGRGRDLVLASAAVGLAICCKYTMGVLLLVPLAAVVLRRLESRASPSWLAAPMVPALAGVVFFAVNPYWLTDTVEALRTFHGEVTYYHQEHYYARPDAGWQWALWFVEPAAVGWTYVGLGALGIPAWGRRTALASLMVLPFLLAYITPLAMAPAQPFRNFVPIACLLVVFAARGIDALAAALAGWLRLVPASVLAGAFTGVAMLAPLGVALSGASARSSRPDSRRELVAWLESRGPVVGPLLVDEKLQLHPEELTRLAERGYHVRVERAHLPGGRGPRCYVTAPYPADLVFPEQIAPHNELVSGLPLTFGAGQQGLPIYRTIWASPEMRLEVRDIEGGCAPRATLAHPPPPG